MPRYIDADALIEQFDEYIECNRDQDAYANNWCADVCEVLRDTIVKVAPTIEARPVVRGEWVLNKDGSGTCNQCGRTQKDVWDHDGWQNFCGHCGADMRTKEGE